MTIVQICGCTRDHLTEGDVTPFVSNHEAEFYGVYLSLPDGRFDWFEDFETLDDAIETAHLLVAQGCASEIDDKTFD